MTWATDRRLDFIDWCLARQGEVQRGDLVAEFGVSQQQASADLGAFEAAHPGAMNYDKSRKRYVPARSNYLPRRGAPAGYKWQSVK